MVKRKKFAIQAICGNEERWIKQWCDSILKANPDYIAINLTQFDDNSEKLLKEYLPAEKLLFTKNKWEKDFSKARNQAMELIPDDVEYCAYIDMDEAFTEESYKGLEALLNSDDYPLLCLVTIYNALESPGLTASLFYPRIFPMKDVSGKSLNAHFDGTVHNQLIIPKDIPVIRAPISLMHWGYALPPEEMAKKHKRSEELLRNQIAENPDSFFSHLNLAQLLRAKGDFVGTEIHAKEVIKAIKKKPKEKWPTYTHGLVMAYDQLSTSCMAQRRFEEGIEHALNALELFPEHLDSIMNLGNCHLELGHFDQAMNWYKRFLFVRKTYNPETNNMNLILNHLNSSHIVLFNMGIACMQQNNIKGALANFKKSFTEEPEFVEAFIKYIHCLRVSGSIDQMNKEIAEYLNTYSDKSYRIYGYFGDVSLSECNIEFAKFNYYQACNSVKKSNSDAVAVENTWEGFKQVFGDLPDAAYDTYDVKKQTSEKVNLIGGS